ncbi:MAG: c-type cytochrome biogenesis protein CcmI [Rhodospirillales bacterium]|nr:c-type cytochrome biogenesis protein CcmI [Rhodospirillales bacterium]
MMFYLLLAVLTALVVAVLLHPLLRRGKDEVAEERQDLAVYKAQLAEIERDLAAGTLLPAEAGTSRLEVQRRILAADADRRSAVANGAPAKRLALAVLLLLPLAGFGLYSLLGAPDQPAQPHADREDVAMQRALQERATALRAQLAELPDDPEGWQQLAMMRSMLGQFGAAAAAYKQAIALGGEGAALHAALAEALILQARGEVTEEARKALGTALDLNANERLALYYLGHALEQDRHRDLALQLWQDLAASFPEDSKWQRRLKRDIERVGAASGQ